MHTTEKVDIIYVNCHHRVTKLKACEVGVAIVRKNPKYASVYILFSIP